MTRKEAIENHRKFAQFRSVPRKLPKKNVHTAHKFQNPLILNGLNATMIGKKAAEYAREIANLPERSA